MHRWFSSAQLPNIVSDSVLTLFFPHFVISPCMITMIIFCVCANLWIIGCTGAAASNLRRCRHGDTDCIAKSVDYFAHEFSNGLRDVNLIGIDPLLINKVDIIQQTESPVSLNLNLKDVLFYGLSKIKTKRVV